MKGTHHIIAHDQLVLYEFDVKRNITIIRGDSATGKTTLYNIIRSFNTQKSDEPGLVYVDCDKPCIALGEQNLEVNLRNTSDSIVFLDEESIAGCDARELSKIMQESDNYYVIITRDALSWLPYSITEIYRLRGSCKDTGQYRIRNRLEKEV